MAKIDLLKAHVALMVIGWAIMMKISVFTTAFYKNHQTFQKNALWFKMHIGLNTLAFIFTLSGILCVFAFFDWTFTGTFPVAGVVESNRDVQARNHVIFGLLTSSMMVVNFILGLARPDKENGGSKRKIWELVHTIWGYLTLIFADVTLFLGTYIFASAGRWSTGSSLMAGIAACFWMNILIHKFFLAKQPESINLIGWGVVALVCFGLGIGIVVSSFVDLNKLLNGN